VQSVIYYTLHLALYTCPCCGIEEDFRERVSITGLFFFHSFKAPWLLFSLKVWQRKDEAKKNTTGQRTAFVDQNLGKGKLASMSWG
jgi:hypothetical protein